MVAKTRERERVWCNFYGHTSGANGVQLRSSVFHTGRCMPVSTHF